jgi:hypothetical protein
MSEKNVENESILITLSLWKKGKKSFTKKELNPVKSLNVDETTKTVTVVLNDKTTKVVKF